MVGKRSIQNISPGDILDALRAPKVLGRFWSKVESGSPSDCWLWVGARWKEGYGKLYLPGPIPFGAHRASWIIANQQPQPDGYFVCHRCDNKPCVNPAHLYLGKPLDNSQDAVGRGQIAWGSRQGSAKLNELDIHVIRQLHASGLSQTAIAKRLGVSQGTIWQIVRGNYWKRVPSDRYYPEQVRCDRVRGR